MNFRSQYSREQKTEEMTLMLEFLTNDGCITALYEFIELYRYVTAGWTTAKYRHPTFFPSEFYKLMPIR